MTEAASEWDVFFSYARDDLDRARPLLDALEAAGVRVWRDEARLETFADIQAGIRDGLARCRVMLAFFTHTYPKRRACDWELAAVLTSKRPDRVLVVNPERGDGHITPRTLVTGLYAANMPEAGLAAKIKARAAQAPGLLGAPLAPPANQIWHDLRQGAAPPRFVGRRQEIWQIHDGLLGKGSVLLAPSADGLGPGNGTAHVRGLGGVGKTLLAEEYAHRFAAVYPGGLFRLRAGGGQAGTEADVEGRRLEQLTAVARTLGVPMEAVAQDPAALEHAVQRALAGQPAPYLWLIDDLPHGLTAAQAQAWFAPTGNGRTLLTTRDGGLDGLAAAVDLGLLAPDEAYILLTAVHAPTTPHEEHLAREICALLGHHPLAVDVTARLVRRQGYAWVESALRNPESEALELAAKMRFELPTGHDKSIAATLLLSIKALSPAASDALRLASVLAWNQPIPGDLLAATMAVAEGRDPTQTDQGNAILAVDEAASHSLCEVSGGAYTVHGLVCRTMRLHEDGDRGAMLHTAAVNVLRGVLRQAGDIRTHTSLAPLIPHAQTLAAHPDTAEEADLIGWVGRFFMEAGTYALAQQAFAAEWEARARLQGAEHPRTLTSMNNLAGTLGAQGDRTGARVLYEQVLEAQRRILGTEHPDTLTSMNNLASTLGEQGDHAGARALQEQVLEARCRILGAEHPDTLTSMNNLASTLGEQGDHAGARALQEQVLEALRRALGAEHPDTLTSMNNLASTLWAQRDHAGARALEEQVLEARRRVLGTEHPDTLTSMSNLAATLRAQGDRTGARELQEQVLEALRRALGAEHPHTLTSMNNLAGTLGAQGDHAGARALQEQVLEARRRILGAEHPDTLGGMNNLAETLRAQGDRTGARALQEQVLEARRRILGAEHPDTLTSMNNLAGTLWAQGDHAGARALLEQVVEARRRVQGAEHPGTLTSMNNLASTLWAQGDHAGARALLEQVVEARRRVLGAEHPETLTSINNLAATLGPQGVRARMRALLEQALKALRRILG